MSLYVHVKTSLNSFRSLINYYMTTNLNETFTFTCCTFSLVPKLTLVSCSSLVIIQSIMVRSCIHSQTSVSSIIISPTSGWKKVSSRCYLTMSSGIAKLTTKTHTNSTCCFGTSFVILISNMKTGLEIDSIRVSIFMVPIENKSKLVANITSCFS